jgi:predicted nucleotidyltransferase
MASPNPQAVLTETDVLPVTEARILEIGRTIGQQFRPQEVILFGSYARGDQTADSDIDLLVVFPHDVDKAAEAIRIRHAIGRINTGVDIVVGSAQEVAEWEDVLGTVFYYARREGRPIYGNKPGSRA